jgi:hypothetical protein
METKKFWLALAAFALQGITTVFFLGAQTQAVKEQIVVLKRDIEKIENNQNILIEVVRDVALLKAKDFELERRIQKVEKP